MGKRIIRAALVVLFAVLLSSAAGSTPQQEPGQEQKPGGAADIEALSLAAEDNEILLRWNRLDPQLNSAVRIRITDGRNTVIRELAPEETEYHFTEGEHGRLYLVTAQARRADGTEGEVYSGRQMFLDFARLPGLPLLVIDTASGREPVYELAEKPQENLLGRSITGNAYEQGRLTLLSEGRELAELYAEGDEAEQAAGKGMEVKLRVRGNTSVVMREKLSYKLKLSEAADLFGDGDEPAKNWVLLNCGTSLNNFAGECVGELCGLEWQMRQRYVNVILNGDWKGTYVLAQSVGKESGKSYIAKDGMIFENDAYWWNDDGASFRLANQDEHFAYTFKYPDVYEETDEALLYLQDYMQQFEDRVLGGDPAYAESIDAESFAAWILARDILGQGDAGGTNMYFYKKDRTGESKVKMGPLWDFDSAFSRKNQWSACRAGMVSYFPQLFEMGSFQDLYTEKWRQLKGTLASEMARRYSVLLNGEGAALQQSWELDAERWNRSVVSVNVQIADGLGWFAERSAWMDVQLGMTDEAESSE